MPTIAKKATTKKGTEVNKEKKDRKVNTSSGTIKTKTTDKKKKTVIDDDKANKKVSKTYKIKDKKNTSTNTNKITAKYSTKTDKTTPKKVRSIKKTTNLKKIERDTLVDENIEKQKKIEIEENKIKVEEENNKKTKEVFKRKEEEEKRKKAEEDRKRKEEEEKNKKPNLPTISINELITVKDLAEKMNLKVGDILRKLMSMGTLATINQRLDTDTAILIANEFGFEAQLSSLYEEENIDGEGSVDDTVNLKPRSPIVTIMGHVDHGKTSLLDAIRNSNVIAKEAGGITQHIGAYRVKTSTGEITFLDTPGHEAFTAMRSRGAQATDIVILVVSAADGVMPQTIEAINHAKAANVPIIVAVNKIDLPTANPEKIRQEISNYGLLPEEWGGDTIMVNISAKQKINIDSLLELVQLKAEMMELKANPNKHAEGIVIEAKLDSKRGAVATVLVQSGTLHVGDNLVVGTTYGKVRAMIDEYGNRFDKAIPSMPVEILGLKNEPPQAGDKFIVLEHESQAREIANSRKEKVKADSLKPKKQHVSLLDLNSGTAKHLKIILKTDVQGSLGALCDALERMSNSEINLEIIHKGAGSITESDVVLAAASDALIVGFNIRPDASVEKLAETEGVNINVYRIIYDLIADIKAAMEGLLDPDTQEKIIGKAIVKQVFKLSSVGTVAGCTVTEGKVQRNVKIRLLRDNVIIFEGNSSAIKRFKEDVKEVEKGYECGISLENFSDIKVSDVMEFFTVEKTARKLVDEN